MQGPTVIFRNPLRLGLLTSTYGVVEYGLQPSYNNLPRHNSFYLADMGQLTVV